MMSADSLILIGTEQEFDTVSKTLASALDVAGVGLPGGRIWFELSDTASAWLDPDPLDLVDEEPAPDVIGARWEVAVRDTGGPDARAVTARMVFDLLECATDWQLVLMIADWGPADAHRPLRTRA